MHIKPPAKHFIVSQNLTKSGLRLPDKTILRVNLAWHKDIESVKSMLTEYAHSDIFLDIPIGRKKPPNHDHNMDEVVEMANGMGNIKYVAISNVEDPKDVIHHSGRFKAKIVPKIETLKGTINLRDIMEAMNYAPQIIMLDHEDLFSNLVHLKKEALYLDIVARMVEVCRERNAHLLRVKGIIFSDE